MSNNQEVALISKKTQILEVLQDEKNRVFQKDDSFREAERYIEHKRIDDILNEYEYDLKSELNLVCTLQQQYENKQQTLVESISNIDSEALFPDYHETETELSDISIKIFHSKEIVKLKLTLVKAVARTDSQEVAVILIDLLDQLMCYISLILKGLNGINNDNEFSVEHKTIRLAETSGAMLPFHTKAYLQVNGNNDVNKKILLDRINNVFHPRWWTPFLDALNAADFGKMRTYEREIMDSFVEIELIMEKQEVLFDR